MPVLNLVEEKTVNAPELDFITVNGFKRVQGQVSKYKGIMTASMSKQNNRE
jgi:hypothetical protein